MMFKPGDEVVCVDIGTSQVLKRDTIYDISDTIAAPSGQLLILRGYITSGYAWPSSMFVNAREFKFEKKWDAWLNES